MEKIIINFGEYDVKYWDYKSMILESLKDYLFPERNVEYIFPQIKKWWPKLKNNISKWLTQLWIKQDFNVWFVSTRTEEAIFKVIFNK